MKISTRIQQLNLMISDNYQTIWDCCCDHGLLGMLLLQRNIAVTVHFNDIVETLTVELTRKLNKYFPQQNRQPNEDKKNTQIKWQVHHSDVKTLFMQAPQLTAANNLSETPNNKHLIIIAGVGGDKVIDFVSAIVRQQPNQNLEFLLCPVHHNYRVRQFLISLGFGLINERLIQDKGQYYELLHVSQMADGKLSLVGASMWDFSQPSHNDYLAKTITHYQQKALNPDNNIQDIILAYQTLLLQQD